MTGLDERDARIGIIYDQLSDVFPDAARMFPAVYDPVQLERLNSAGLDVAEIHLTDDPAEDEILTAVYIFDEENVVARALTALFEAEAQDEDCLVVPQDAHAIAIESIRVGFDFPLLQFFVAAQP